MSPPTGASLTKVRHGGRAGGLLRPRYNFDFAILKGRLALTFFGDALTNFAEDRDDRTMRDAGQLCRISGV